MVETLNFNNISEYNAFNNHETLHPLVSVIDFSKANHRSWEPGGKARLNYGIYCIFLKEVKCGDLKYGRHYYDYQEGTLVFVAPGQSMDVEYEVPTYQPMGHALVFHPDLIKGTALAKTIGAYNFFGYQSSEALHLSERERRTVMDCFSKITEELQQGVDKHSKKLITANIELFLNYCERFYDRQFITRDNVHKGIVEKLEALLNSYFASEQPQRVGLPSVAYCADQLHLSANYFGDLVKKETGKSAQEYIQSKVIDLAKAMIYDPHKSISEVAIALGFKYPQHFTRLFKQKVGVTPVHYRDTPIGLG